MQIYTHHIHVKPTEQHQDFGLVAGGHALIYTKASCVEESLTDALNYLESRHLKLAEPAEIESSQFYESAIEDEHDLIHYQKANLYGVALHISYYSVPDGETIQ
ncbi:MAG: hypothetical protein M0Q95_05315 [Porticoccaceae bacterium]|nr:hypothetical protein [Porticoccaceae bacterium]